MYWEKENFLEDLQGYRADLKKPDNISVSLFLSLCLSVFLSFTFPLSPMNPLEVKIKAYNPEIQKGCQTKIYEGCVNVLKGISSDIHKKQNEPDFYTTKRAKEMVNNKVALT